MAIWRVGELLWELHYNKDQSLPVQEVPFPEKPVLQAQEKVPGPVEVQVPLAEQLFAPVVQLLIAAMEWGGRNNNFECEKLKLK